MHLEIASDIHFVAEHGWLVVITLLSFDGTANDLVFGSTFCILPCAITTSIINTINNDYKNILQDNYNVRTIIFNVVFDILC